MEKRTVCEKPAVAGASLRRGMAPRGVAIRLRSDRLRSDARLNTEAVRSDSSPPDDLHADHSNAGSHGLRSDGSSSDGLRSDEDVMLLGCLCSLQQGEAIPRAELRDALAKLRHWAHHYARARFARSGKYLDRDLWDVTEDATQHLAIALTERRAARSEMSPEYTVAWSKRVVTNFVVSELRRRSRTNSLPGPLLDVAQPAEPMIAISEALDVFIREIRSEVGRSPSCRDSVARLALVDEFLEEFLTRSDTISDRQLRNRLEQRRSRGRRFAREAWARLRAQRTDLSEIACALGLELESESDSPHD